MPNETCQVVLSRALSFALLLSIVSCVPKKPAQMKTSIYASPLKIVSRSEWRKKFGYQESEVHSLYISPLIGCPFIKADVSGTQTRLMFDTGTSRGFMITNQAPSIPYTVIRHGEELNADGSHRGQSDSIHIDSINVLGKRFKDVTGTYADWRMFSSAPFEGTLGLDFFLDRRITLDYLSGNIAVSTKPLPDITNGGQYLVLDLVDAPEQHGHNLYACAVVNGRKAIVYFDTGYSHSWIDPGFVNHLTATETTGRYRVLRQKVPVELGGQLILLSDVREGPIRRGPGFDLPVALALGSDFLTNFIVTIDLRSKKFILARSR